MAITSTNSPAAMNVPFPGCPAGGSPRRWPENVPTQLQPGGSHRGCHRPSEGALRRRPGPPGRCPRDLVGGSVVLATAILRGVRVHLGGAGGHYTANFPLGSLDTRSRLGCQGWPGELPTLVGQSLLHPRRGRPRHSLLGDKTALRPYDSGCLSTKTKSTTAAREGSTSCSSCLGNEFSR